MGTSIALFEFCVKSSQGLPIRVLPGNRTQLGHSLVHPFVEEANDGNREGREVIAESTDELRGILRRINERRPLTKGVDAIVSDRLTLTGYLREPIGYTINNPGDAGNKSLVKSVLALTCHAGVDPNSADAVIEYLTNDDATKCIFPYYRKDLVSPRILDMPLNCVYVKGDPSKRKLMGYVEVFGFLRKVVRLSDAYEGEHFDHYYAMDPRDGSEQQVGIILNPTIMREAEEQPDYQQEKRVILEAIRNIAGKVKERAEEKELNRLVEMAISMWYAEHGKESGVDLTNEERYSLSGARRKDSRTIPITPNATASTAR